MVRQSCLLPKGEASAFPSQRDAARTERSANAKRLVEKGVSPGGTAERVFRLGGLALCSGFRNAPSEGFGALAYWRVKAKFVH